MIDTAEEIADLGRCGQYREIVSNVACLTGKDFGVLVSHARPQLVVGVSLLRLDLIAETGRYVQLVAKKNHDRTTLDKLTCIHAVYRKKWDVAHACLNTLLSISPSMVFEDDLFLSEIILYGLFETLAPYVNGCTNENIRELLQYLVAKHGINVSEWIASNYGSVDSPCLLVSLGYLAQMRERHELALDVVAKIVSICPDHPDAMSIKLYSLSALGHGAEMLAAADSAELATWHQNFSIAYHRILIQRRMYWKSFAHLLRQTRTQNRLGSQVSRVLGCSN